MGDSSREVGSAKAGPAGVAATGREALRTKLERRLSELGLRWTAQRRTILEALFSLGAHFTVDELVRSAHRVDRRISAATVYRMIHVLVEAGLVEEHRFGERGCRYELADDEAHHDHLVCVECGKIQEFEEPLIEQLQSRVAAQYDFEVLHHAHSLYGRCGRCRPPRRGGAPG